MCALRRQVYLTTLESTRSATLAFAQRVAPNEATAAGLSNFCAGAFASLVTQSVIVPVDVVSQKLMVAGPAAQPATAVKSADGFPSLRATTLACSFHQCFVKGATVACGARFSRLLSVCTTVPGAVILRCGVPPFQL